MTEIATDPGKKELTTNQLKAISLILAGYSTSNIAKEIKISRVTLYRWQELSLFQEILNQERQKVFDRGINRLKSAVDNAVLVLIKALGSKNETSKRLAAQAILNLALKTVQDKEIEERLEKIEQIIKERYIS